MNLYRAAGAAVVMLVFGLTGCSAGGASEPAVSVPVSSKAELPVVSRTVDSHPIGEPVGVSQALVTIDSVEAAESWPTLCSDAYVPAPGRSLWAVRMTVVNTGLDVIYPDGQLVGGSFLTWRDTTGGGMSFVFPDCTLEGQHVDGLLMGESASTVALVEGAPGAVPGWVEFSAYVGSDPVVIVLKDGLNVTLK